MVDYFYWKNFFSKEQIQHINIICKTNKEKQFHDHPAYSHTHNKTLKKVSNVYAVQWKNIKHKFNDLINQIKITNLENYGYNIFDRLDTDHVLFNTYYKNDFYNWHKDGSNNPYHDIKFTILINNSLDEYTGGDFQIFSYGGENNINEFNSTGSVLMLKSDIPHRVLPIETGTRSSIVLFIKGTKFI